MKSIFQLLDLTGRLALVTGAAVRIGRTIVDCLAELGSEVILVDRPGTRLDDIIDPISRRWGIEPTPLFCDLEDEKDREQLVVILKDQFGFLDILVNNAAFVGESSLIGWTTQFEKQSVETWRRAFEVNLTAVFEICQRCTPLMKSRHGASIINIASIYGSTAPDTRLYENTKMGNPAAYAASKGGLLQLTRWLSTVLAPNIRVNAISPGGVFSNQPSIFVKRYNLRTPLRRMATEEDIKGAVAYLASDLSAYVTGQNLIVDGGWTVW